MAPDPGCYSANWIFKITASIFIRNKPTACTGHQPLHSQLFPLSPPQLNREWCFSKEDRHCLRHFSAQPGAEKFSQIFHECHWPLHPGSASWAVWAWQWASWTAPRCMPAACSRTAAPWSARPPGHAARTVREKGTGRWKPGAPQSSTWGMKHKKGTIKN